MRIIAIDWSGASSGERSKVWLAEVADGRMTRLECGRSRDEVIDDVIEEAGRDRELVVGLDFAFSLPEWFFGDRGLSDVEGLWTLVGRHCEEWLAACEPPFWGRPGRRRPDLPGHFRRTDTAARIGGIGAKSVFQIGGAGAVGTGSLRGMPHLARLRSAGFAVWPFHEVRLPLVIEIYPRVLTGPVRKSSQVDRQRYLASGFPEMQPEQLSLAASSEDAFDAAVSAVVMARCRDEIARLERARDPVERLEGRIWAPADEAVLVLPLEAASPSEPDCPFCGVEPERVVAETRDAIAIRDRHPLARGHTLVLPKAHGASLFAHPPRVQAQIWALVSDVRAALETELAPHGFNVGVNDGSAAGQTVAHAHVHVIPRFEGDVADPRGGVRWVIPERAAYWTR